MSKLLKTTCCLIFVLVAPLTARAELYTFDTAHTQILFFVSHLGFSKSQGEFLRFSGGFDFNPNDFSKSNAEVIIQAKSLDMDDEKWNQHMKSEDYFHVEKYPTLVFRSTKVVPTSDTTFDLHGDLTMLGNTHPVIIKTKFNKSGPHPKTGNQVAGFSATAELMRSQWGMKRGVPFVGDEVEIRIEVEGIFQR